MPLYQIERDVSGWTDTDLEAAAVRTQTCAAWFEGMEWLRSFHDPVAGRLLCYYRAAEPADLERHARAAEVPCDRITEVVEVLPLAPPDEPA
jgi:hypothetical protein